MEVLQFGLAVGFPAATGGLQQIHYIAVHGQSNQAGSNLRLLPHQLLHVSQDSLFRRGLLGQRPLQMLRIQFHRLVGQYYVWFFWPTPIRTHQPP